MYGIGLQYYGLFLLRQVPSAWRHHRQRAFPACKWRHRQSVRSDCASRDDQQTRSASPAVLCRRPSRPHYGSCSSVRPSVRPSVCLTRKLKGVKKPKLVSTFRRAAIASASIFSSRGQRSCGRPHNMSALSTVSRSAYYFCRLCILYYLGHFKNPGLNDWLIDSSVSCWASRGRRRGDIVRHYQASSSFGRIDGGRWKCRTGKWRTKVHGWRMSPPVYRMLFSCRTSLITVYK